jgi:sporulation protein YlmC with PRC-barrel domain
MRIFFLAFTAVSALATAVALAQTAPADTTKNPATGPSPATTNLTNPINATPTPSPSAIANPRSASGSDFIQLQSSDMLSSNLVGLVVYDGQRNDLGKIKDVAFDTSKKVTADIVAVGGVLGMGTRYVAVSPDAISVSHDANNKAWRVSMSATKDELKTAPEFKYTGQWNASRT